LLFERYLSSYLFGDSTLAQIRAREPDAPWLEILATNLTRGTLSCFSSDGFIVDHTEPKVICARTRVAVAVATSAAFPGFFPPVQVDADSLGVENREFPTVEYLTDGGVFDNLGIRRLRSLLEGATDLAEHTLICDASGHLDWESGREFQGLMTTAVRSTEILMHRIGELERETFLGRFAKKFVQLEISESVGVGGGLEAEIQKLLKFVRTDLDYFSEDETHALEAHGYEVAEKAGAALGGPVPIPGVASRVVVISGKASRKIHEARNLKPRLFSLRDPLSYLHVLIVLVALAIPSALLYSAWSKARFLAAVEGRPSDTFGLMVFSSSDEADAYLPVIAEAGKRWPKDPEVQAKVALVSYSIYNKGKKAKVEADRLLAATIATLEGYPAPRRKMRPIEIAHQLKGHYFLAKESYSEALSAYESFFTEAFPGLYGAEFNVCNSALAKGDLTKAEPMCLAADLHAQDQEIALWGAKFDLGNIAALRGDFDLAMQDFREAWAIAAHKSEDERAMFRRAFRLISTKHPQLCAPRYRANNAAPFCP
jgi:tetratricopeptide (TPR) repeat protein